MIKRLFTFVAVLLVLLCSCSKPADVSGYICGAWESEWEENIGEDDVEDIRVKEQIGFVATNQAGSAGNFVQVFEGEVDFDDWDYEQTIKFSLYVEGKWHVEDNDNVVLRYDLDAIQLSTGKSKVDADYSDAVVDLLTGNWGSALVGGLMQESVVEEANKKIDKAVQKQLLKFFKDMFRQMNMDKEAMTDVVISGDNMECEINFGFFGRDAVYDRLKTDVKPSHSQTYTGTIGTNKIEMELTITGDIVNGRYRYIKMGDNWLALQGSIDDGTLSMAEWDANGNITGTFTATVYTWGYRGTFKNKKGKSFNFEIR